MLITFSHDEVMDAVTYGIRECAPGDTLEQVLRAGMERLGTPIPDGVKPVLTATEGDPPTYELTVDTAVKKRGRRKGAAADSETLPITEKRFAEAVVQANQSNGTG